MGYSVGFTVGDTVGVAVGDSVGVAVGDSVGVAVGDAVGAMVGTELGLSVGAVVGRDVEEEQEEDNEEQEEETGTQPSHTMAPGVAASVPARAGQSVLDLGCGVGAVALCLGARVPGLTLTGVERQPDYAALAQRIKQDVQVRYQAQTLLGAANRKVSPRFHRH